MTNLLRLVACLSLLVLSFAAAGCGGNSKEAQAKQRRIEGSLLLSEVSKRSKAAAAAERKHLVDDCQSQVGGLVDSLEELHSRLAVGLTFSDYSEQVGTVRVAYDKVDVPKLGVDCLGAAADGEIALNDYVAAYNVWNDCMDDLDCSADDEAVNSKLQAKWSVAGDKLDAARSALDEVGFEVHAERYRNAIPTTPSDVQLTVYGGAKQLICDSSDVPAEGREPCARLGDVLTAGVSEDEYGDLDDAVHDLNVALGLETANKS